MSTQSVTKKRKSADGTASATKKVKVAPSADKPAPVKSALKKPEATEGKTKAKAKPAIEEKAVQKSKAVSKPVKKAKKKEKVIIEDNSDDENGGTALTADQTASLLAGFSSESEDDGDEAATDIPTSKIPQAPTTGEIQDRIAAATKTAKKNASKAADDPETTPGVVYIGRIPHGFHEPQMRAYFSQFGTITHLKLARNRKTGKSKHFAFVEFASAAVADIVAKTMDKYLLFNHILQVRRVPGEQVGEGMWTGEGRKGWNVKPSNKLERGALRRGRSREAWEKKVEKEEKRRAGKKGKLEEMGYEFEMPGLRKVDEVPVKPKAVEDATGGAEAEKAEEVVQNGTAAEEKDAALEAVVVEKTTKKRPAEGRPKVKEAKKAVKKIKT